jgi:FkbM family methyltransferase
MDPMTTASGPPDVALDALLADLRAEAPAQIAARTNETWLRLAGPSPSGVVIFGCGQLGRFVLPGVRAAGLLPLAYCDNNPRLWGTEIDGVPVLAPVEAVERFGATVPFLVAIYNASPVRLQLAELGCRWIVPYPAFFWEHSACLPAEEGLDLPQRIAGHLPEIEAAYELLDDDRSRREYLAQIRWRCLLDYDCLPARDRPADMYFPPDLVSLSGSEVLVDCGAFDGDSIRLFLEKTAGRFARIHAFEPDARNIAALTAYLGTLPEETAARIEVQRCALGRANGFVRFSAEGTVGSKVSGAGTVEIPCRTLDSALAGCVPTFVKMDIEGAEIDAIPGAARIAVECRPILAACAYHRCSDLWTLPGLLKAANPEYRVFLRRYAEECWETVYYAIPPERLPGRNREPL